MKYYFTVYLIALRVVLICTSLIPMLISSFRVWRKEAGIIRMFKLLISGCIRLQNKIMRWVGVTLWVTAHSSCLGYLQKGLGRYWLGHFLLF